MLLLLPNCQTLKRTRNRPESNWSWSSMIYPPRQQLQFIIFKKILTYAACGYINIYDLTDSRSPKHGEGTRLEKACYVRMLRSKGDHSLSKWYILCVKLKDPSFIANNSVLFVVTSCTKSNKWFLFQWKKDYKGVFSGKIISLALACPTGNVKRYILFKAAGTLKCKLVCKKAIV